MAEPRGGFCENELTSERVAAVVMETELELCKQRTGNPISTSAVNMNDSLSTAGLTARFRFQK